jgi:hypothetical protein
VLPDEKSAPEFQRTYRVESMSANEYLGRVKQEDELIAAIIEKLKESPTPKELVYRYGPDVNEALRAAAEKLEQYLRRKFPPIDLGIQRAMKKWGPDIMELYRFARSKLSREQLADARRVVILPEPEKMAAKDVISIVASAHMASRSLMIIDRAEAWVLRQRQLAIEQEQNRSSSIQR